MTSMTRKDDMTKPKDTTPKEAWFNQFVSGTTQDPARPAFRATPSPSERKAEESTRVARETTEAAAQKRQDTVAKLKAARLAKEAEDRAQAGQAPAKAKKPPKGKKPEGTLPSGS